jgi:hypothetical protein
MQATTTHEFIVVELERKQHGLLHSLIGEPGVAELHGNAHSATVELTEHCIDCIAHVDGCIGL